MPTKLQEKVAEIYLESKLSGTKKSKGQMLKEAGASVSVQLSPTRFFASQGFDLSVDVLTKKLQIDRNSILVRLSEIAWDAKDKRSALSAIDLIAKVVGMYAPTKSQIDDIRDNRREIFKAQ